MHAWTNLSMRNNQVADLNPLATVTHRAASRSSGNPIQTYDSAQGHLPNITDTDYELLFVRRIPDTRSCLLTRRSKGAAHRAWAIYDARSRRGDGLSCRSSSLQTTSRRARAVCRYRPAAYFVKLRSTGVQYEPHQRSYPLAGLTKLISL